MSRDDFMKHLKNITKTLPLLLLPLASSVYATDITATLSFSTLPVITVAEETPMDFGEVLSLSQADTCAMDVLAGPNIALADEGFAVTAGSAGGGTLSSDCSGSGQPGVYTITSFSGADITVNLTLGTPTDISFVPVGNLIDVGGDARVPVAVGTGSDATASTAINAYTLAGTNRIIVAGTITNQAPLTSGGIYNADFNIEVVYQ